MSRADFSVKAVPVRVNGVILVQLVSSLGQDAFPKRLSLDDARTLSETLADIFLHLPSQYKDGRK